jgi:hypothetical protein
MASPPLSRSREVVNAAADQVAQEKGENGFNSIKKAGLGVAVPDPSAESQKAKGRPQQE